MNNSEIYKTGLRFEKRGRSEEAYKCFLEAAMCEQDGEAILKLGHMYYEGDYVHENYDKAGYYYGMAYDLGADVDGWSLVVAGGIKEINMEGNEENFILAEKYYKAALKKGMDFVYDCLGEIYYKHGDYDKAYENLKNSTLTSPCGLYYLGILYEDGLVVTKDVEKAIEYYFKAVEANTDVDEYGYDDHSIKAMKRLEALDAV